MDTKAAFEEWWRQKEQIELRMCLPALMGYHIWQASRQAIEVELPSRKHSQGETTMSNDYMGIGFNLCVEQCKNSITSLGIRVKGNEE